MYRYTNLILITAVVKKCMQVLNKIIPNISLALIYTPTHFSLPPQSANTGI